jgi:hypothetical protein
MDRSVDAANGVHLIRHAAGLVGAREIADNHTLRSANELGQTVCTRRVSRVEHHFVPILKKLSRCRQTQIGRRAGQ